MRSRIPRQIPLWLFLLLLLFWLFSPFAGEAADAKITDIIVTPASGNLQVFATLQDGFPQEIEEGIVNGVSTAFTYFLRLMKNRALWPDAEVSRLTVRQTVTYDPLKDRFAFTSQGGSRLVNRGTNSFNEIRRWLSSLEGVIVASYGDLRPGDLYYVQVRAEIRSERPVLPPNVLFFFVASGNVDTPWASSPLFRVGP